MTLPKYSNFFSLISDSLGGVPVSLSKFKVCQIEHQINFILMICKGSNFLRIIIKVIWKSIEKADQTAAHSGLRLV